MNTDKNLPGNKLSSRSVSPRSREEIIISNNKFSPNIFTKWLYQIYSFIIAKINTTKIKWTNMLTNDYRKTSYLKFTPRESKQEILNCCVSYIAFSSGCSFEYDDMESDEKERNFDAEVRLYTEMLQQLMPEDEVDDLIFHLEEMIYPHFPKEERRRISYGLSQIVEESYALYKDRHSKVEDYFVNR